MKYKERILVIENDIQIQNFISYILESEGFSYALVNTGENALDYLMAEPVDLLLLELDLPDLDGLDIIRKIRTWSQMPILVVSSRDQDTDKAIALGIGADDYITKPFSAIELIARIRVAIRHLHRQGESKREFIRQVDQLKIDFDKHITYLAEEEIHLTPLEYQLLSLLFQNMGKVVPSKQIIEEIYGKRYGNDTQSLRTLIAGLRRKIEINPAKPRYIRTEIGIGYRLMAQ